MSEDQELDAAIHWMLLRLAGWLPDDLMTQCRTWLALGRHLDIGRAIAYALLTARVAVSEPDLEILGRLLSDSGADPSILSIVDIAEDEMMPMFGFAESLARAEALLAGDEDDVDDLLVIGEEGPCDEVETAAVQTAQADPAVIALWRAWRFPVDLSPWPPPRRVYVAEVADGDLLAITGKFQEVLAAMDDPAPQVEVCPTGEELPVYQRLAWAFGTLLWTRIPDRRVRVAAVFDEDDTETGPRMYPDHPAIDGEERDRILAYLRRGEPLLLTETLMEDVVDPVRPPVVPMNFRTDGYFVWNDASIYYLGEYGLRPDPELVDHIQNLGYEFPTVDGASLYRALAAVQKDEELMAHIAS